MMEKDKSPDQKKQASHFMAFYVVALFSIALVLILLSYLTQVRADDQIANAENQLQEQVSATQGIQAKMEIIQEASNEQALRIAELEQSLAEAEKAAADLDKRSAAQSQLVKVCGLALAGETELLKAELDHLISTYTLEALDGSDPEQLIWTVEEVNLFERLRSIGAGDENTKNQ